MGRARDLKAVRLGPRLIGVSICIPGSSGFGSRVLPGVPDKVRIAKKFCEHNLFGGRAAGYAQKKKKKENKKIGS